jgi:hypothetical protein
MRCRFSGHCFYGVPCLRKRSLCLAELLALAFCSQRICCPVLCGCEASNALLLRCFWFVDHFMYLHADIYAKYDREKCMVLFARHKYMARSRKGKLLRQHHYRNKSRVTQLP